MAFCDLLNCFFSKLYNCFSNCVNTYGIEYDNDQNKLLHEIEKEKNSI